MRSAHPLCMDFNPPTPCGVGLDVPVLHGFPSPDFNPPTPCGVGLLAASGPKLAMIFQSTHPVRGRACTKYRLHTLFKFQSTHPVRGGTADYYAGYAEEDISIHPPRAGWDAEELGRVLLDLAFQSTHPVRGGTSGWFDKSDKEGISIHPPRAGWD